ncbi:MAG: winged helix-turn-helix domain-containing protein [Chitinophagaceae bacterium]
MNTTKPFYINNRFLVVPQQHSVEDKMEEKLLRTEPRIMQLLCLLASSNSSLVGRDELVTAIWKDYGGGDEGLTQGISILRKLLHDDQKEIIQTIPKKGYCFNASVEEVIEKQETKKSIKRWPVIVAAAVVLVAIIIVMRPKENAAVPKPITEVSFPKPGNEENEFNTVTTTAPDKTVYKLVVIGDRRPVFYKNGVEVPPDEWDRYFNLIDGLKKELKERRRLKK